MASPCDRPSPPGPTPAPPPRRRAGAGLVSIVLAGAVLAGALACRTGRPGAVGAEPDVPTLFTEAATGAPTAIGSRGQAVVFLPGYGATTGYWRGRIGSIVREREVVLVDLLGFGRSSTPDGRYSVDRHVAALRRTLAARGPLVLVGHSFGARLAVSYAARYPDDVRALVLVALPYYPDASGRERARAYFTARGGPGRSLWTSRRAISLACVLGHGPLRWAAPHVAHDLPADVRADGLMHTPHSATSTLHDALYGHDLGDDIARLRPDLPVTLVHGTRDRTAPPWSALAFAERHPAAVVRMLPDIDHHPLLRAPHATLALIDSAITAATDR